MNGLAKQYALELEVANFGPIVEAKIDLRPLTVFVGPSNTGKSYLAILIYALHRFFRAGPYPIIKRLQTAHSPNISRATMVISICPTPNLTAFYKRYATGKQRTMSAMWLCRLRSQTCWYSRYSSTVDGLFKEVLAEEITRSFGVEGTKDLIRHPGSNNAEVVLQSSGLGEGGNTAPFKYALSMTRTGPKLITAIPEEAPLRVKEPPKKYGYSSRLLSWRNDIDRMVGVSEVSEHIANSVLSFILGR